MISTQLTHITPVHSQGHLKVTPTHTRSSQGHTNMHFLTLLWSPCVTDADMTFFLLWFLPSSSIFFPRLFSAVADWTRTILPHMMWPSNTMWPGPSPTYIPSFILIHPTVWPQYTNVTDRTDRHTDRQDRQGYQTVPRANHFTNGCPKISD